MNRDELTYNWKQFEQMYRWIAKRWHPDHQPADRREAATRLMQWLNAYYDEARASYLRALRQLV